MAHRVGGRLGSLKWISLCYLLSWIDFSDQQSVSGRVARVLGNTSGGLHLNGLTTLSLEATPQQHRPNINEACSDRAGDPVT